jgi:hypothetical protein
MAVVSGPTAEQRCHGNDPVHWGMPRGVLVGLPARFGCHASFMLARCPRPGGGHIAVLFDENVYPRVRTINLRGMGMAATYAEVKEAVIDLVDDATEFDVMAGYGEKYSAKTKLVKLGISPPLKAFIAKPLNKRLRRIAGSNWHGLGVIDLMPIETIGALIERVCGQAQVAMPAGEPT